MKSLNYRQEWRVPKDGKYVIYKRLYRQLKVTKSTMPLGFITYKEEKYVTTIVQKALNGVQLFKVSCIGC